MAERKDKRMQETGSPSTEPNKHPKSENSSQKPGKKHEKYKASDPVPPEWQDPEFDPSDIFKRIRLFAR